MRTGEFISSVLYDLLSFKHYDLRIDVQRCLQQPQHCIFQIFLKRAAEPSAGKTSVYATTETNNRRPTFHLPAEMSLRPASKPDDSAAVGAAVVQPAGQPDNERVTLWDHYGLPRKPQCQYHIWSSRPKFGGF